MSVTLLRGGEYVFSEPVECVVGIKNEDPDLFLEYEDFCEATLPPVLETEDTTEAEVDEVDEEEDVDNEEEEEINNGQT